MPVVRSCVKEGAVGEHQEGGGADGDLASEETRAVPVSG